MVKVFNIYGASLVHEFARTHKGGKQMTKQRWSLLAMLLALFLVLAACNDESDTSSEDTGSDDNSSENSDSGEESNESTTLEFPTSIKNEGTPIEGGTLNVAMQKEEPFQGIFSQALYEDAYDFDLMEFASTTIFTSDGDFLLTDKGLASMEVTKEKNPDDENDFNIVTIKIKEDVKWSDGQPFTIDDVIFPYYIIADAKYTGVRYDSQFQNIVGSTEYHDGAATEISGIKRVDDYTMELHLKEISPGLFSGGDGILTYAEPKHVLGEVPVDQLVEHDAVRKNPLSLGAFVIDNVVPGESVSYKRNEYYWKGDVKLDGVVVKVVPSASIAKAVEAGDYDLVLSFGSSKYNEIKDFTNIDILAVPELYYSYLGFKLGKWDKDAGEVVTDLENSKMGDAELRKAMAYALDVEEVTRAFYDGLRTRATGIIPPVFSSFHDTSLEGFKYDPDKAIELLEAAGYKDTDGDGFREDKDGQPLTIKFATMSGDDVAEQISAFWIQCWEEVGLKVEYTDGRTIEFNSFYDKVEADDPEIDIFMAAWGVASNPSPSGVYAHNAAFNFSRYTSDTLKETIKNIDSAKSFDTDYRAEQFAAFEKEIAEQAPVVPMMYRLELTPVNKRVSLFTVDYAELEDFDWGQVELLSDKAVK